MLLGSIPGVPPATVAILGAGNVGRTAARLFLANGAHVILLDADLERLRAAMAEGESPSTRGIASLTWTITRRALRQAARVARMTTSTTRS